MNIPGRSECGPDAANPFGSLHHSNFVSPILSCLFLVFSHREPSTINHRLPSVRPSAHPFVRTLFDRVGLELQARTEIDAADGRVGESMIIRIEDG